MRIPWNIPEFVLRVFTRHLTPEEAEGEKESRSLRSEDVTWDKEISKLSSRKTLARCCLDEILKGFPDLVRHTKHGNHILKQIYQDGVHDWQNQMLQYANDFNDYTNAVNDVEAKMLQMETEPIQFGIDDDEFQIPEIPEEPMAPFEQPPPRQYMKPVLSYLSPEDRILFMEEVDLDIIPIGMALRVIKDQHYWKRKSQEQFPEAEIEHYGKSWRRLFVEKSVRELVEFFHPGEGDWTALKTELHRFSPFVKNLHIENLLPACYGMEKKIVERPLFDGDGDAMGEGDEGIEQNPYMNQLIADKQKTKQEMALAAEELEKHKSLSKDYNHVDFSEIFAVLPNLRKITIIYKMVETGLDYNPLYVQFTDTDCLNLAKGLAAAPNIKTVDLQRSRVTGEQIKTLIRDGLLLMQHLGYLNLSYNRIGNTGARAIARLISYRKYYPKYTLHTLILTACGIKRKGAIALAYALSINSQIKKVCLRLNEIHDTGGKALANALVDHASLVILDLSATLIGDPTTCILGKMLLHNNKLKDINLSSNVSITLQGARVLAKGIANNPRFVRCDLRKTSIPPFFVVAIRHNLLKNLVTSPFDFWTHAVYYKKDQTGAPKKPKRKHRHRSGSEGEDDETRERKRKHKSRGEQAHEKGRHQTSTAAKRKTLIKPLAKVKPLLRPKFRRATQIQQLSTQKQDPKLAKQKTKTVGEKLLQTKQQLKDRVLKQLRSLLGDNVNPDADLALSGKQLDHFIKELEAKIIRKPKVKKRKRRRYHFRCLPRIRIRKRYRLY